ncbi:MAG: hypothetical protein IH955_09900 [Chloroflexi bacterium]|nr:hypothetical protein [Chloroflexota bacterium]
MTLNLSTQEIVDGANRALPPEWLQEQVEQILDQAFGYFTGGRDGFKITIEAKDRATELAEVIKDLFIKSDTYTVFLDEVVTPEVDKALEDQGVLPFGVDLTAGRLISSVQVVAPEDWVKDQVVMVIDEVTPYFVADREGFEIRIELADRVNTALVEIKVLLRESNAYDLLYDEVITPAVFEAVGPSLDLPYGIAITNDELIEAMRAVAPPDWVQEQAERVIDEAGPYLTGTTDRLQVTVSLEENKADALEVVDRLARNRLEALVDSLPQCSSLADLAGFSVDSLELPPCIPAGIDPLGLIDQFDLDITGPLVDAMDTVVPDSVTFTDADLRQALVAAGSEKNVELIDTIRDVVGEGYVYTDQDLRQDLVDNVGGDPIRALDSVRDALGNGWTYTDLDMRQDIREQLSPGDAEDALDAIDEGRKWLGRVDTYQLLFLPVGAVLLAGIGFLGGRRWSSRLAWAMIILAMVSAITFAASAPVYSSLGSPELDDLRIDAIEDLSGTELLATDKAVSILIAAVDDILSGISQLSLIIMITALVIFFLAVFWRTRLLAPVRQVVSIGRRETPPTPPPPEPPLQGTEGGAPAENASPNS